MAGNSARRGATRKPGSKKGARVGSGGQGRQSLEGRGPTPKATERPYHPAGKRKIANERRATTPPGRSGVAGTGRAGGVPGVRASRSAAGGRGGKGVSATHEIVGGRNSVVEALRAGIPVSTVYYGTRIETDDRTREILATVTGRGYPLLEVSKAELDRLTDGAVHQGVAIQVPPYEYADPDDLLDDASGSGTAPLIVALDGVTDPRNLGAVLRSAGAFGAHGVLVPERRSAGVTASAWKVSAGAAARVPVARDQPHPRATGLSPGRLLRGGARRGRRRPDLGPAVRDRRARARHRVRGQGPDPARPRELRCVGVHPDRLIDGVPQRGCCRRDRAVRGGKDPHGRRSRVIRRCGLADGHSQHVERARIGVPGRRGPGCSAGCSSRALEVHVCWRPVAGPIAGPYPLRLGATARRRRGRSRPGQPARRGGGAGHV